MLTSIFANATNSIELTDILICSVCAIVLGVIIAITHKITSRYSKNFLVTLSVLPLVVQIVIMLVNGNLGMSVAIAGTFSLIRFRSIAGTSKEILSVFLSMAVGLAVGMGFIAFSIIGTLLGCLIILILSKITLFDRNKYEKILKVAIPEELDYTEVFNDVFDKFTKKCELEQVKSTNMGSMFELKYLVTLDKNANEKSFIDELRVRNGNLKISLSHPLEEGEIL